MTKIIENTEEIISLLRLFYTTKKIAGLMRVSQYSVIRWERGSPASEAMVANFRQALLKASRKLKDHPPISKYVEEIEIVVGKRGPDINGDFVRSFILNKLPAPPQEIIQELVSQYDIPEHKIRVNANRMRIRMNDEGLWSLPLIISDAFELIEVLLEDYSLEELAEEFEVPTSVIRRWKAPTAYAGEEHRETFKRLMKSTDVPLEHPARPEVPIL